MDSKPSAGWTKVDPANPPAVHMIAIYSDASGAVPLTKFDNSGFLHAEDAWEMTAEQVLEKFSYWAPAPDDFVPHFMTVTEEDWR